MDRTTVCVPGLVILLIACLLITGCTDTNTGDQTVQPDTTTTAGALYSAGDIVKNPRSSATNAWLVIGYDDATDSYERALIYPNADGSWGYRTDTRTETTKRDVMEKVYSEVVEHISPSSVPVVTPTVVTTEPTATAKVSRSATATVTNTPTASLAPQITNIIPDKGDAGTTVKITDLVGANFKNGATVTLRRSGSAEIKATDVRAYTPKSITCSIAIPSDAVAGAWDVVVTNPDGQSATYTNIFSVHRTPGVVATTSALSAGTIPITYIDPPTAFSSNYGRYTITGSGFKDGASVVLKKTDKLDIVGTTVVVVSDTQLQVSFQPPASSSGLWDLKITNPDKSYGIRYGAISIN